MVKCGLKPFINSNHRFLQNFSHGGSKIPFYHPIHLYILVLTFENTSKKKKRYEISFKFVKLGTFPLNESAVIYYNRTLI
jgi:hypothetical protein